MKTFLNAFGWILTAAAITISALAIIAALDYATHTPTQCIGTASTIEHNPALDNIQLETK